MRVEYYWYGRNKTFSIWAHNMSVEDSLVTNLEDPDCNECVMIVPNTCQEELD